MVGAIMLNDCTICVRDELYRTLRYRAKHENDTAAQAFKKKTRSSHLKYLEDVVCGAPPPALYSCGDCADLVLTSFAHAHVRTLRIARRRVTRHAAQASAGCSAAAEGLIVPRSSDGTFRERLRVWNDLRNVIRLDLSFTPTKFKKSHTIHASAITLKWPLA